jgi:FkbH-like protein
LLGWARALAETGEFEQAAQRLRAALAEHPPYAFYARAEKLVAQIAERGYSHSRECRVAILGSSTTSLLIPILQAIFLRDGIKAEIYEAPYGSIQQETLDPQSGLARFKPGIAILSMNWRDLDLPAVVSNEEEWVQRAIERYAALWARMAGISPCHILQPAFDYPAEEPYGHLGGVLPGGRTRVIEQLNRKLRESAAANVSILDVPAVQREVGSKRWENPGDWDRYRQHPAAEALPFLADAQMAHVRAVLGLTRKVLVTDLDNTLWHGVIGEDGLAGIGIGPGTPAGEAHLRLQRYLLDLKRRGILLAVASKNNPDDARLPFQEHPQMALRLEDFAAFRANWDDKVSNLRALAQDLSLGTDSFVFLDDNPLEREWVRSQMPEVAVVELDAAPFNYVRQLDRGRYFETLTLSAEDLARAEQYRVEAQRESLRSSAASLDEFLIGLRLEASVAPVSAANLGRVTQLVNKTNQFNLTTRRYSEAQVREIADDPRGWAGAFEMSDCLGSYGLIGVLFCKPGEDEQSWEIDTWLMSCRTLGRQMEKFMLDRMLEAAKRRGVKRFTGVYRPTKKNSMVSRLYDDFGFRRAAATTDEIRYEFDVPESTCITATHVRNVSCHPAAACTT